MPKPKAQPQHQPDSDPAIVRQARRGHGRVTLQQVALAAGVTSITVSRYLRDHSVVAPDTATRIRQALSTSGYVPNKQAGLLASGVSNIVAALLPNLANSIFAETAQGLSDGLQAAGFELLIASTGYSMEREEQLLRALLGWHPAAVVVTGRRHASGAVKLMSNAKAAGTPVIEIWDHQAARPASQAPRFTQIGFNHAEVGHTMALHLLAAGHRALAYVDSGVKEDYRAHERGAAFIHAARAAGVPVTLMVAPGGDAFEAGRQAMAQIQAAMATAAQPRITAAAFANDNLACGALLQAQRAGLRVPQDLAVLGFGNFALGRQLTPALSSVELPRLAIGQHTATALLDAIRRGQPAQAASLPWTLVARGSTGYPDNPA